MVLHIPVAVDFFYAYLQSRHEQLKDQQAIHLIALYIDLRMYEKACSDEQDEQERRQIATEIYDQYLSDEALAGKGNEQEGEEKFYFPVELDSMVKILFQRKYDQLDDNLNEYLFIEVYAFVLDKLREYFTMFKNS